MADLLDLALVGERVVTPDGTRPAVVGIRDGRIARIEAGDAAVSARETRELGDLTLLPGLVDTHVHVNDPGTNWEGFDTAGAAAAAGGITTIIDMPLNSVPVTTSPESLAAKVSAASGRCTVDYGFWGGLVPGNVAQIRPLLLAGVRGFKCFLCPSGCADFPAVGRSDLEAAMPILAESDAVLLAHAEHPAVLEAARAASGLDRAPRNYDAYLASRPAAAEVSAIEGLVELSEATGCRVHIVHVSSVEAAEVIARARERWVPITAETCPHYLTFAAEEIPDGRCEYKCAPPIRAARQREALWELLGDGVLDLVASDHSPCPPEMKHLDSGDLAAAWGGIASLEVALSAVWTGLRARGGSLHEVARWMALEPARLAGVQGTKGAIEVGRDADLVVFDAEAEFRVDPAVLHHRHPVTPYAGRRLDGVVRSTFVRGHLVYDRPGVVDTTRGRPIGSR